MASCTYKGTTSTFKYGADGLRRQATVNGVTTDYVYDGQTLIREGFASGGTLSMVKATYLQGPRGTECRIDETQQTEGYYDPTTHALKGRGVTKWYVYDGYPAKDTDFGHNHPSPKYPAGPGDPHCHDIGRPSNGDPLTNADRPPGRPINSKD